MHTSGDSSTSRCLSQLLLHWTPAGNNIRLLRGSKFLSYTTLNYTDCNACIAYLSLIFAKPFRRLQAIIEMDKSHHPGARSRGLPWQLYPCNRTPVCSRSDSASQTSQLSPSWWFSLVGRSVRPPSTVARKMVS